MPSVIAPRGNMNTGVDTLPVELALSCDEKDGNDNDEDNGDNDAVSFEKYCTTPELTKMFSTAYAQAKRFPGGYCQVSSAGKRAG